MSSKLDVLSPNKCPNVLYITTQGRVTNHVWKRTLLVSSTRLAAAVDFGQTAHELAHRAKEAVGISPAELIRIGRLHSYPHRAQLLMLLSVSKTPQQ